MQQNLPLVKYIVKRFLGRGKEYDDLYQTGCIGLLKAIRKFDCSMNVRFSTYAVPLIMGEIRRLLRDDNSIHVSRSLHDLSVNISHFRQRYEMIHGAEPGIDEIASEVNASFDMVMLAINSAQPVRSLSEPLSDDGDITIGDMISVNSMESVDDNLFIRDMLNQLDPIEQSLIRARFFERRTQKDVGERLGCTQVQISRMESRILRRMRDICSQV